MIEVKEEEIRIHEKNSLDVGCGHYPATNCAIWIAPIFQLLVDVGAFHVLNFQM